MNLESLKAGFQSYLQSLSEKNDKDYSFSGSEISIFMYAKEFKEYISDELNVDPSIMSKSISEIMDMEIVNGQLVEPEEEPQYGDSFNYSENTDIDEEGTTNIGSGAEEDGSTQIPAGGGEAVNGAVEGDSEGVALVPPQNPEITETLYDTSENLEDDNEISITDMLNELFNTESIKSHIDIDGSGDLSKDEILTFLDSIKDLDGDDTNISLEDIFNAVEAINNEPPEGVDQELWDDLEDSQKEEVKLARDPEVRQANGVSGSGGSYGPSGNYGSMGNYNSAGVQEKTLQTMNLDELNSELSSANADLSEKQNALSAILDGSDPKLSALQDNIDSAYSDYQEQLKNVDEDLAKRLDDLKTQIDAKEDEIDAKEQEICDQEIEVSNCENAYNNAVSTKETMETTLTALKAIDTSDMSSDKIAELNSKISELEEKLADAEQDVKDAKEAWDNAKDKLEELQEQKKELETGEGGLSSLNEQMTQLEGEILEKCPEIKEYMDAYKDAKSEYDNYKTSALSTAKKDVSESQKYVNDVKTAINEYNNKQITKEYSMSSDMAAAIDWARQYDDYSQAQIKEIFAKLGYQFDSGAWCADFVRMVYGEAIGDENLPEWYQNIPNKAYCPTIQQYAKGHEVSAEDAKPGDLVLFDWDGDGSADHVGIFIDNGDGTSTINTIEGNTSGAGGGSCVEEKSRTRGTVLGIYSMS